MSTRNIISKNFAALATFAVVIFLSVMPQSASATLIGPGAATMGGSADGPNGRTNIERDFVSLGPGNYTVQDFEFWAVNTSGTVQPFLALQTTAPASQRYTPIWVGSAIAPGAAGTNTDTFALGSELFSLASAGDVYAGFVMTETAVGFFGGGLTDHNGAPPLVPTVGVELPVFTNNNLGRTYSFGVNIELASIPEPSTFGLAFLGLLSLGFAGWRRRMRA